MTHCVLALWQNGEVEGRWIGFPPPGLSPLTPKLSL
jgi:hypothetical protein